MRIQTDQEPALDETTTVKLQMTKRQRLWLQSVKIMTGRTMSGITREALDLYMEEEHEGMQEVHQGP